jgi:hypothetical protein
MWEIFSIELNVSPFRSVAAIIRLVDTFQSHRFKIRIGRGLLKEAGEVTMQRIGINRSIQI